MYRAIPFQASSPDSIIMGRLLLSFTNNLEADMIANILPKHGFETIDPDVWYSQQRWMDVLKDISDMHGSDSTLVAVGKRVVEEAVIPPEIQSIPDAIQLLHLLHHMHTKNVPTEEGYTIRQVSNNHYRVYHNTPNPDIGVYGYLWALAARFNKPGDKFRVAMIDNPHPNEIPGTVFDISWGAA